MKKSPKIIKGSGHSDERGSIYYNNEFNATEVKRVYFIENNDKDFVRGWQGHKVEQRWFLAVQGSLKIVTIAIDDWETPCKTLEKKEFVLQASNCDVLHVPQGHITSIQALETNARLMAMSDYCIGEIKDEHRFTIDYFETNI
jgi:dTDP-4-dehydrorhamnose 3,5-epimerase-like enzyme